MKYFLPLLLLCLLSCSTTTGNSFNIKSSHSYAKILEDGEKLYAFRMPIDSSSQCLLKGSSDAELLQSYSDYFNQTSEITKSFDGEFRKVTKRNIKEVLEVGFKNQDKTMIVAKLSIDKRGRVIAAELLEETTTAMTNRQKRLTLVALMGYRYEETESTACIESGKIQIRIQNLTGLEPY